ncbi:response regulator transcription factor [Olsenella sp. kh2p3]|uniref:response regulator n=1 Tax=Olsenella sp. kh2p3 TaxID=1797112 RepID=UPI00091D8C42|nr:response regulator transcription factor [Olsenella sp. kh2p3]SFX38514.1 two component transcriptional regulator, LuxR family [Olsenella sp. kh2p3]
MSDGMRADAAAGMSDSTRADAAAGMRVIVVDDDAIVVRSLATILGAEPDVEVVGTGTSGEEAVSLYSSCSPDVALMDIQMPGGDGLSAAEKILAADPAARVVFLTTFSDDDYIVRALRLGARGYLIKQDVATIAPALRSVMAGQSVLEGEVLARAAALSADGTRPRRGEPEMCGLTEREREVVRAIADGMSNAEVAAALYMSEGTVRNHISAILAKLGLRNRTQIAVYYYRA